MIPDQVSKFIPAMPSNIATMLGYIYDENKTDLDRMAWVRALVPELLRRYCKEPPPPVEKAPADDACREIVTKGWLARQIEAVRNDIRNWPEEWKKLAGFEDAGRSDKDLEIEKLKAELEKLRKDYGSLKNAYDGTTTTSEVWRQSERRAWADAARQLSVRFDKSYSGLDAAAAWQGALEQFAGKLYGNHQEAS